MVKKLFLTSFVLLSLHVNAYDFYLDGFYYNLLPSNKEVEVTHSEYFNDYGTRWGSPVITIPDTIIYMGRKMAVTSIGEKAFMSIAPSLPYCKGIILPHTIKHIGDEAFYMFIKSQEIIFPEHLETIGYKAFLGCSFKSLSIPSSVKQIGDFAFSHITNLEDIHVDETNEFYDSRGNCNAIIETKTNTIIAGCINTTIPSSIEHLGVGAFWGAPIENIVIGDGVNSIGESCFSNCTNLKTIKIANTVKSIGKQAFLGCGEIESLILPDLITTIDEGTFWGMKKLKSIIIPEGVIIIKKMAFEGCESLTELIFPESIRIIEKFAYTNCTGITSISIPKNVTSIGEGAFRDCVNLTEFWVFSEIPISLIENPFPNLFFQLGTLYVPLGAKSFYQTAEIWRNFHNIQEFNPCSINDSACNSDKTISLYSLDGIQLFIRRKGLNIIHYSNGKTKKVLTK